MDIHLWWIPILMNLPTYLSSIIHPSTIYHTLSSIIYLYISSFLLSSLHLSPICLWLTKNSTRAGTPSQFSSAADAIGKELSHRDPDMYVQKYK